MTTLLLGKNGMLARAFTQLADQQDLGPFIALDRNQADITNPDQIRHALQQTNPDVVINCAAYTAVDAAEEHENDATDINGHALNTLAQACQDANALLVNYSTDYVFNGQATSPYTTDQPRDPLNAYGRSKAVGEAALETSAPASQPADGWVGWLNLRTSWLYAPWGNNFVLTMARLTREKDALQVVDDQRGRPTSCQHLAQATLALIKAGATGHHHLTDDGDCTWFEFTQAIAKHLGQNCNIQPCASDQYPRPAKRPAYSVLDLTKTQALLGPLPHWRDNLADVLNTVQSATPTS